MKLLLAIAAASLALVAPTLAGAAVAPVTWCGTDEVTALRSPDVEPWQPDKIRFIYAIPSDGDDHFAADASAIATDAAAIDPWWRSNDPTRAPRFALTQFPGCTTTFGALDIAFVRLPHPGSYYASQDNPAIHLDEDLANAGLAPTQKSIVYYDAPAADAGLCGVTDSQSPDGGGRDGLAYVLVQSGCSLVLGSTTSLVAAHELLHNLGAVPSAAPHTCFTTPSHVCDSRRDIMWPYETPGQMIDAVALDVGHDDYYGHSGSWWDVRNSDWLLHLPLRHLHVGVSGQGAVQSAPAELPCSAGCDIDLEDATPVQLRPAPAPGWAFAGWTGACSAFARCTFAMQGAEDVSAQFVPIASAPRFPLSIVVRGRGRIVSLRPAFSCVTRCSRALVAGGTVALAARPAVGYRFAGWSGACHGRGTCIVPLDRGRSVSAVFVRR